MKKIIDINKERILITGCAGFIGGALALRIIEDASAVIIGIDNMNDYYDVRLKEYRLKRIEEADKTGRFIFNKGDISDKDFIKKVFGKYKPTIVINLAAQAGVRYSIDNPDVYINSNIIGFYNILECCRNGDIKHFLFASSSSVYGNNKKTPYSTEDMTDKPVSLYAATKKSNELLAYSYSKLYGISTTGLRFFTVYGPMGRPDMAYYSFTDKLINGKTIKLYNYGKNQRDFTYIDDVVKAIYSLIEGVPEDDEDDVKYKIYNVGNHSPIETIKFARFLFDKLKKEQLIDERTVFESRVEYVSKQPGDVEITYADTSELFAAIGYQPDTDTDTGLEKFVKWYKEYLTLKR